ncbi:MAG: quinol monooxygenase YgiN [Planctomycetota bacterium]|jgi:quinol monooxygenase YgiN
MIRVIIEREIVAGLEAFYEKEVAKLLDIMTAAPGYLSGESLVDLQKPNHYVVITRWTDESAWERWCQSSQRQQLVDAIQPFLQSDEKQTRLTQLFFHQDKSAN